MQFGLAAGNYIQSFDRKLVADIGHHNIAVLWRYRPPCVRGVWLVGIGVKPSERRKAGAVQPCAGCDGFGAEYATGGRAADYMAGRFLFPRALYG